MTWDGFLRLTSETVPNNATSSVTYDSLGRVATSTSVVGAVTSFNYYPAAAPPYTLATTNGKFVKTTIRWLWARDQDGGGVRGDCGVDCGYGV
jgi:hypothetical protein